MYSTRTEFFQPIMWAPSSEFVSSSIPSRQILTAHAQPFRGARDLAFCLKVPLDSLLVWTSSEGSRETARMRRLAWTFAARIRDKYQIRLTRSMTWYSKAGLVFNIINLTSLMTKPTEWFVRPAKTQISQGIHPFWSGFAVRMKKPWALNFLLSAQWKLWSDWADVQADPSLRWAQRSFCWFCHEGLISTSMYLWP